MRYLLLLPIICCLSCNVINPKEATPRFLHIDSITVNDNTVQKGTNSSKIVDAWVYANNNLLGAFELPANIPIIEDGDISIIPGIAVNGVSGIRDRYNFLGLMSQPLNWDKGTKKILNPVLKYQENTKLIAHENFEFGNSFLAGSGDTTFANVYRPDTNVYEGNSSGTLYLSAAKPRGIGVWSNDVKLNYAKSHYIELNYKCDVDFEVKVSTFVDGVYAEQSLAGIRAKPTWNKIYLELGSILRTLRGVDFKFIVDAKLPGGRLNGYVYLDNFKVLGFE